MLSPWCLKGGPEVIPWETVPGQQIPVLRSVPRSGGSLERETERRGKIPGGRLEVPYKTLRKLNKYYLPDSHGLMNKTSVKTFSENINHV